MVTCYSYNQPSGVPLELGMCGLGMCGTGMEYDLTSRHSKD